MRFWRLIVSKTRITINSWQVFPYNVPRARDSGTLQLTSPSAHLTPSAPEGGLRESGTLQDRDSCIIQINARRNSRDARYSDIWYYAIHESSDHHKR